MRTIAAVLFAGLVGTAPSFAAEVTPCGDDPDAVGLRSRMEAMHRQITRIHSLSDRGEQRRLIELHAKHMHEGLRELRRREPRLEPRCHVAMMHSLLEQLIVHQETVHDLDTR